MRLKDKGSGVPGGFRYYQAETQTLITAPHWWELSDAVRRHRNANRIVLGEHEVEIEEQLAAEVAKRAPHLVDDGKPDPPPAAARGFRRSRSWQWSDVAQFTATMVDSLMTGNKRVEQNEADRRAGLCGPCPSNIPLANCNSGCSGLKGILATAISKVAGGATKFDDQLQACEFCGCLNRAQIWFPKETLVKQMPEEMIADLPDFCWKGKDVTNPIEIAKRKLGIPDYPPDTSDRMFETYWPKEFGDPTKQAKADDPANFVTESNNTGKTSDFESPSDMTPEYVLSDVQVIRPGKFNPDEWMGENEAAGPTIKDPKILAEISGQSASKTVYHESPKEVTDMNKIFVGDGPDDTDDGPIDATTSDPAEARRRKVNKMFPEVVPIPPHLRNLKGGEDEMKKTKKGSKKKGM